MNKDTEYTPIDSILEIQNNLRMDLLDKRFIDKNGNKFVVRFGKESRKLEVLLVKSKSEISPDLHNSNPLKHSTDEEKKDSSYDEIQKYRDARDKVREADKKELLEKFPIDESEDGFGDIDLNIENTTTVSKKNFENSLVNPISLADERRYIFDLLKNIEKNKDRIVSTLLNVQNSRVFELTGDPSENKNIVSNFTRDFESEVFRIIENFQNRFKEITSYPKTTHHYSMSYSLAQKDFLSGLESDKQRLDYILRWEMQEPALILIKKFAKMVTNVLTVLNAKEEDQIKTLSYQQQTLFRDSKTAALYCLNDLDFLKRSIENWKDSAV